MSDDVSKTTNDINDNLTGHQGFRFKPSLEPNKLKNYHFDLKQNSRNIKDIYLFSMNSFLLNVLKGLMLTAKQETRKKTPVYAYLSKQFEFWIKAWETMMTDICSHVIPDRNVGRPLNYNEIYGKK